MAIREPLLPEASTCCPRSLVSVFKDKEESLADRAPRRMFYISEPLTWSTQNLKEQDVVFFVDVVVFPSTEDKGWF